MLGAVASAWGIFAHDHDLGGNDWPRLELVAQNSRAAAHSWGGELVVLSRAAAHGWGGYGSSPQLLWSPNAVLMPHGWGQPLSAAEGWGPSTRRACLQPGLSPGLARCLFPAGM